jgi:limonene-1,2-epoxide hydrolase
MPLICSQCLRTTDHSRSLLQVAANRLGVRFDVLRKTANGSHVLQINRRLNAAQAQAFAQSLRRVCAAGTPTWSTPDPTNG